MQRPLHVSHRGKVLESWRSLPVTGSLPSDTRSSHTPGRIWRFEPRTHPMVAAWCDRPWDDSWDRLMGSRRAGALAPALTCPFLVAGAGFEPATFGL